MRVATYLVATEEVVKLVRAGRRIEAIKLWRKLDHRLADGTRIVPGARVGMSMVHGIEVGLHTMPMAVMEGGYSLR